MMVEKVKIHGLDEVRRALKRLPKEVAKKELLKSLTPGAALIRKAARSNVPTGKESFSRKLRGKDWEHKPGQLRKSIVVRNEKKKFLVNTAMKRVGVLVDKKDVNRGAWYWRFVEFGTSKMQAQPFLAPAYEANKYKAVELIKQKLLLGVERQANKVKAR